MNNSIDQINDYLLKQSNVYMPSTVLGHPTSIQVEISNICNLKCIMCPIEDLTAKKGKLTLDKFEYIISQFPFLRNIGLYGIG